MRKSLYAPVSLKSAQDLVRYLFPVFVEDRIPTTSNQKTLESNSVCRARHNHDINSFRERSRRIMYVCTSSYVVRGKTCSGMYVRVHSWRGKTLRRQLSAAFSASAREVNHIDCLRPGFWPRPRVYNKHRCHFPVLVSSNTLGTPVRSHRCLVGALGGMLCVRQHQCDHVATAKQTQII